MSTLTQETRFVQNPALGGTILWRFACGYTQHHKTSDSPTLPLIFIVLPIVLHHDTFELLKATRRSTGLHGFADKFSRSELGKTDVLFGIQSRATAWRRLTWESVQLAIRGHLITLSCANATVIPLTTTSPTGVPETVRPLLSNADKLGEWCSGLSVFEIGAILKVAF